MRTKLKTLTFENSFQTTCSISTMTSSIDHLNVSQSRHFRSTKSNTWVKRKSQKKRSNYLFY